MAGYLLDVMGARRIYALDDSSAFGKGLVAALESALATRGATLSGRDAFHVGDLEFSPLLARIEAARPDVVVAGCMAAEGSLLRKQMVERKLQTPFVGFSGIFYETFIQNSGPAAEGTRAIFPLPPLTELPGGSEYEAAYKAAGFNEPFESAGPFGYVAGQVAVQTLLSGALTRPAIVEHLRTTTFDTAFGRLSFDDRGEMRLRMFCFYTVRDGKWTVTHRVRDNGQIEAIGS
jgi:branched-chain amino acid transport system substrate-binding protein